MFPTVEKIPDQGPSWQNGNSAVKRLEECKTQGLPLSFGLMSELLNTSMYYTLYMAPTVCPGPQS
ncbi:hypothetical protein L9F63_008664, partial [Diploptera punctata]